MDIGGPVPFSEIEVSGLGLESSGWPSRARLFAYCSYRIEMTLITLVTHREWAGSAELRLMAPGRNRGSNLACSPARFNPLIARSVRFARDHIVGGIVDQRTTRHVVDTERVVDLPFL